MNRRFDERIAMNADSDARRLQCEFNLSNHVVQRRTVESAHIQALNEDVTRSGGRCPGKLLLNMTSHEEVRDSRAPVSPATPPAALLPGRSLLLPRWCQWCNEFV